MRLIFLMICLLTTLVSWADNAQEILETGINQRLIVLADMGNEPDEEQQITHLMLYTDQFDLEGLIAVTGKYLNPQSKDRSKQTLHPELFHKIINGYEKVYKNLLTHSDKFSSPDYLRGIVASGQSKYGIDGVGSGLSSDGSRLLVKSFEKEDERPIFIVVNAGSNTLAQALLDYKEGHSLAQLNALISKLRVFENGAQDDAGAWICKNFPEIYWVRSNYQAYCYGGPGRDGVADNKGDINCLGPYTWEPYEYSAIGQHHWALTNIIGDHGQLGMHYPIRQFHFGGIFYLEGGGTVPWLCLIDKGLSDINNFHWGGWSGRYTREKQVNYWSKHQSVIDGEERNTPFCMYIEEGDAWVNPENGDKYDNLFASVWRWRRAAMNDHKYRMDWCIESFENANHNPISIINGNANNTILMFDVSAKERITLDASTSTDPDCDELYYNWTLYPEAGGYSGDFELSNTTDPQLIIDIPANASGTIHIILELRDNREYADAMFDYRRVILNVN